MDVIMPKMGESVNEGTIIKWHKKQGEAVKRDEIIFEISTDKVDTEIPAPADGILSDIKFTEGDTVPVGTVVAVISSGEEAAAAQPQLPEEKSQVENAEETTHALKVPKKQAETEPSNGNVVEIPMPKMGESVMEGTIIKWYKKVGEHVNKDETLFEISTDKVDTEVPSPEDGIVNEILVAEQETVSVGTVVAKLVPSKLSISADKKPAVSEPKQEAETVELPSMHDNFKRTVEPVTISEEKKKSDRFYSPLVLNIAQKENVSFDELELIDGTGIEGRVTKKDILSFIESRKKTGILSKEKKVERETAPALAFYAQEAEDAVVQGEIERIPMDNIRQKIMQHMINSRDTSVHVSAMLEVDMTRIYQFIQNNRDNFFNAEGIKLTYMPFISHAAVKALREFPFVNSTIDGTTIIKKKFVNLGIAVALEPNGLIVPNIKNAHEKNIIGLAKAINGLAEKARSKKLVPDDISGGTFTITNYGVFGTIFGTPIINQPEVAILGVGTVQKKPAVLEIDGVDAIAIKPVMNLTLAHDHRLVDGMIGGRFLKFMKDTLENFNGSIV